MKVKTNRGTWVAEWLMPKPLANVIHVLCVGDALPAFLVCGRRARPSQDVVDGPLSVAHWHK